MASDQRALVLFSGGLDSTVCLAWALSRYAQVETVGFDYGQPQPVELEVRPQVLGALRSAFPEWRERLGPDHVIKMAALVQIATTALTSDAQRRLAEKSLPSTFVPGRNLLFLTYAAAIAFRRDLQILVGGMSETDYSDYPDSRDKVLQSLQRTLSLGMDQRFTIETPLMRLDKAQTWQLAADLGGEKLIELLRAETHSCYMGVRDKLHAWGRGCGICPACALRAAGWDSWQAMRNVPAHSTP
ncbi:MAG: 7-cyano-7-deazaguanine synthase QueC [Gemmatimonadota bacterium]